MKNNNQVLRDYGKEIFLGRS